MGPRRRQTPFGDFLDELLAQRGLTVRGFGRQLGIDSSLVSAAKRLPPTIERMEPWADALGLTGAEREHFIELAWLAHAPPYVVDLVNRQRARLAECQTEVEELRSRRSRAAARRATGCDPDPDASAGGGRSRR